MKHLYITALLVVATISAHSQTKPKQHVFYDTVKTVKTRVDYSPDTIPVFFKELIIGDEIAEHWVKGFVVWQTYCKNESPTITMGNLVYGNGISIEYYKQEYPEATILIQDTFLYADRKTKVTNKVIFAVKR